ncbi:protein-glutamate O-methyltransferase CheR [Sinimarinibacterium sp. NLF-5-8]|uniref:CheR family methyltransferase n=1 Tax=Sinimarinibacterium sp. NLF-5-8 TaxID=2698684 RepID=UPI00137C0CBC|nr:protein-glutamate O-methyltransferase CheR [Sinimarinibacterium sp. NLF-5-8]QHS09568.1 protein-glutamate O-methyltransferase CheR [Sinimarinibacterium sp. NLF-5-8]
MDTHAIEEVEISLLIEALHQRHGYDFSQYAPASFKRRVRALQMHWHLPTISQVTERALHDPDALPTIIARLTVPVSALFRDPDSFDGLHRTVFAYLSSYPRINIWQAGCARGEETYSLAILLSEAGLYDRCRIYATDISTEALAHAREGIYPARSLPEDSEHYHRAGGQHTLSDYFHARYGHLKFSDALKRNIVFAEHNLAADGVFCEAQLVICRNVLIYFQPPLQDRAIGLFRDTLVRGGFLSLGSKEALDHSIHRRAFECIDSRQSLYRLLATQAAA